MFLLGEVLEKATRALTDEDKALFDKGFVGENGRRRKLEVSVVHAVTTSRIEDIGCSLSWVVKN